MTNINKLILLTLSSTLLAACGNNETITEPNNVITDDLVEVDVSVDDLADNNDTTHHSLKDLIESSSAESWFYTTNTHDIQNQYYSRSEPMDLNKNPRDFDYVEWSEFGDLAPEFIQNIRNDKIHNIPVHSDYINELAYVYTSSALNGDIYPMVDDTIVRATFPESDQYISFSGVKLNGSSHVRSVDSPLNLESVSLIRPISNTPTVFGVFSIIDKESDQALSEYYSVESLVDIARRDHEHYMDVIESQETINLSEVNNSPGSNVGRYRIIIFENDNVLITMEPDVEVYTIFESSSDPQLTGPRMTNPELLEQYANVFIQNKELIDIAVKYYQ